MIICSFYNMYRIPILMSLQVAAGFSLRLKWQLQNQLIRRLKPAATLYYIFHIKSSLGFRPTSFPGEPLSPEALPCRL